MLPRITAPTPIGKAVACRVTASDSWELPMKKVFAVALLTTAFALLLVPALSQAAKPPISVEKSVLRLVNRERAERGLAALHLKGSLTHAARAHSRDMARRGVLTHVSANGDGVATRLVRRGYSRKGYRSWSAGETIACARTGTLFATPEGILHLWMNSTPHRQALLKAGFRNAGIGVAKSTGGTLYFTLDLGRRER